MTCPSNIPESLCQTWQETEAPECIKCENNHCAYPLQNKAEWRNIVGGGANLYSPDGFADQNQAQFKSEREDINLGQGQHIIIKKHKKQCERVSCCSKMYARGMCESHYRSFRYELSKQCQNMRNYTKRLKAHEGCMYPGCIEQATKTTYCQKHYDKVKYQNRKARKIIHVRNGKVVE